MHDDVAEHRKRQAQRGLFDSVAELYDACRPGYPDELVAGMVATSGVGPGRRVLEIGCGTGQLTRQLVTYGAEFTAIDLGPSMIAVARRHLPADRVALHVSSFEDYSAPDGMFDLIVAATAFHWIDPEVAWAKIVRLLAPGAWLAVLSTREQYDDPLGAALLDAWIRRSDDRAWLKATTATVGQAIARTGLFAAPTVRWHTERRTLPSDVVLGLELTRATSLSYDEPARESFRAEVAGLLRQFPEVGLEQRTSLTMAQALSQPGAQPARRSASQAQR
jgi:ubiquinone/menaquinone biosynthesis C-methylase UbiE